jgi:hypothetical protein
MFRKYIILSTLTTLIVVAYGSVKLCVVCRHDIDEYKQRADEYRRLAAETLSRSASQTRHNVRKDIWFTQEDATRLQYRVESESSILTLAPRQGKFEIVENLKNIKCWMQEKLICDPAHPSQQVRFLQATDGIYRLSQQQFLANSVALSLFRLPGHTLATPTNTHRAFLRGTADDVSFSISGKTPQFEAHHFTASLRQEEPTNE